MTYLVLGQIGKRFNDGSQRHLALFGQISGAGEGVGGAAHEPGTGIAWEKQKRPPCFNSHYQKSKSIIQIIKETFKLAKAYVLQGGITTNDREITELKMWPA